MLQFHEVVDARKGRCNVASVALRAGSCVLRTPAFCAVSSSSCGWCFAPQLSLQRCTGCRQVQYCSRKCQKLDWSQHRHECQAWRSIPVDATLPTVLLVCRLAAKLFLSSKVDQEDKNRILNLRHHLDDHTAPKQHQFCEMTPLVHLLLSEYKVDKQERTPSFAELQEALKPEILKLFGQVSCNGFSIMNGVTNEPVGIGLFLQGSMFNHDCDPNCVVSFHGQEMNVHVIKDVKEGQELTISYVEVLQSTKKRQKILKDSYFFECQCSRCTTETTDDWYLDGLQCGNKGCPTGVVVLDGDRNNAVCKICGTIRNKEEINRYEQELQTLEKLPANCEEDKWKKYQQMWEIATRRLKLHPRSSRAAVLARDISNFLTDASSVELQQQALPFCFAELHTVEWLLPKTNLPFRGSIKAQIGKLLLGGIASSVDRAEQLQQATKHLQEALSVLECAHGSASDAVRATHLILEEVYRTAQ
ncbi:SET domain-containing protein [Phytophthora infestans]|uniref:SET domain-containing protein n=1 Tax=Phytophthora infestans TaxID=4787 RepID=A0A8S9TMJ5_PHYIN|nr:SET domain-containing protein [Phytophthora infestans]